MVQLATALTNECNYRREMAGNSSRIRWIKTVTFNYVIVIGRKREGRKGTSVKRNCLSLREIDGTATVQRE